MVDDRQITQERYLLNTQIKINYRVGKSKHSFEPTHFRPSKFEQDSQLGSGLPNGSKPKRN